MLAFLRDRTVLILCVLSVFLHLSSVFFLGFHRDELLYLSLGQHPDWGYASVPPLIGWVAWVSTSIFGFSMLTVKIVPALLSGALVYLVAQITRELGGDRYAQILAAVVAICVPFTLRAFILFQPVCFDIFFWTLILYLITRYINSESDRWLYILGAVMGIAILNKYLVLLLLFALIVVLPFTKHRDLFRKAAFYKGLLITLIITMPNIIWQLTHGVPLMTHMSGLEETQLQFRSLWTFWSDQLLMLGLTVVLVVAGMIGVVRGPRLRRYGLVLSSSMIVLLVLFGLKGKGYYAAGIYPFWIAAGVVVISQYIHNSLLKAALPIGLVLLTLPFLPIGIPLLPPAELASYFDQLEEYGMDIGRVHEDGEKYPLPQDYADMLGWPEIADLAKQAYDQVEDKEACLIYGENYGIAGAVSLYGERHDLPQVVSFSDNYRFWAPESFDPPITSFVYINDELGEDVAGVFADIQEIGRIDDPLSRQYGVTVYLCQEPITPFGELWTAVLESVRGE